MMTRLMMGAVVTTALLGGTASADDNRFAVVTLNNNTRDVTVHLSYRWGTGEWKSLKNFKPGTAEWFAIPLDANGHAPRFEVKINEAIGANQPVNKTFVLKWKAVPDKGARFGHQHEIVRDKSDNDYVSVYDQGK